MYQLLRIKVDLTLHCCSDSNKKLCHTVLSVNVVRTVNNTVKPYCHVSIERCIQRPDRRQQTTEQTACHVINVVVVESRHYVS
jgi:hypothetical protein